MVCFRHCRVGILLGGELNLHDKGPEARRQAHDLLIEGDWCRPGGCSLYDHQAPPHSPGSRRCWLPSQPRRDHSGCIQSNFGQLWQQQQQQHISILHFFKFVCLRVATHCAARRARRSKPTALFQSLLADHGASTRGCVKRASSREDVCEEGESGRQARGQSIWRLRLAAAWCTWAAVVPLVSVLRRNVCRRNQERSAPARRYGGCDQ